MKSRILNKAVSILMIGIALAGTLISCDGAANAIPQDMEEVEVKATIIDETKSLEAYFGETVANNVTHYRWVMTHKNPTRVYDTGYVPRATAEANEMFANMNGSHKILTGAYDWTFAGYVHDGAGSGDANYHKVAEASNTDEIINAKTQSVSIVLDTLVGQNQGAEITAKIPVDFYSAWKSGSKINVSVTSQSIGLTSGPETQILSSSISVSDAGSNAIRIDLPSFDTGSYNLKVELVLRNAADTEDVDVKRGVTVLRSITGSTAKGEMDFTSTSLTLNALGVTLTDKTGDVIIPADINDFVIEGLDTNSYTNNVTADIELEYPHMEGISVVWYIDGIEAGTDKIDATSTVGDVTTYQVKAGAIEEGDHILTAVLVDRNMNMSAGSITFKVTVKEDEGGGAPVGTYASESDIKNKVWLMNFEESKTLLYYGEENGTKTAVQGTLMDGSEGVTAGITGWSYEPSTGTLSHSGSPQSFTSCTVNGNTLSFEVEEAGSMSFTLGTLDDHILEYLAFGGFDSSEPATMSKSDFDGYWEGTDSTYGRIWMWFDSSTGDTGIGTFEDGGTCKVAYYGNSYSVLTRCNYITMKLSKAQDVAGSGSVQSVGEGVVQFQPSAISGDTCTFTSKGANLSVFGISGFQGLTRGTSVAMTRSASAPANVISAFNSIKNG